MEMKRIFFFVLKCSAVINEVCLRVRATPSLRTANCWQTYFRWVAVPAPNLPISSRKFVAFLACWVTGARVVCPKYGWNSAVSFVLQHYRWHDHEDCWLFSSVAAQLSSVHEFHVVLRMGEWAKMQSFFY